MQFKVGYEGKVKRILEDNDAGVSYEKDIAMFSIYATDKHLAIIQAAPEMLEALESITHFAFIQDNAFVTAEKMQTIARAIIRKAKGE